MRSRCYVLAVVVGLLLLCAGCDGYTAVHGTIRDESGAPVAGAAVIFTAKGSAYPKKVTSSSDGTYKVGSTHAPFGHVPLTLVVAKEGYGSVEKAFNSTREHQRQIDIVLLASRGAGDLHAQYVGKSSCTRELWGSTGNYGLRLDKTQNAYLAAHTVQGKNILAIVRYDKEGDRCGVITDLVEAVTTQNYFEFVCVDCGAPSDVVVGTWPENDNSSSATAVEAWRIDLKQLAFTRVSRRVRCVRRSYAGSDEGEDLVTWGRKGLARHCPQPPR